MENEYLPNIGISIGDINGIGPEVILKALHTGRINKICNPIIYGSGKHLSKYKHLVDMRDWQYVNIPHAKQANSKQVSLINCLKGEFFELNPGKIDPKAGQLAFESLKRAAEDLKKGEIDALVTAPLSKDNTQGPEFNFPGHTEYLAHVFEKKDVLMFMVSEQLKMGVVTGHIPLEEVKRKLSKEGIIRKTMMIIDSLKNDFWIQKPKVAILGLNPHAGENGLLGKEENEIINPAINEMKKKGNLVFGPFPTDGFFATNQWKQYDAVLAMYHDQGLTPFKMLAFETGVNFTVGLPGVRTSPDHGTAFDIAGKNIADPTSMLHAIYTAIDIAKTRKESIELDKRSLKHQKIDIDSLKKEKN
ncbi:4-hydroxythreonine-4-phosphate dehydrogenase PdxA [Emticicia sp. CRIBPO]|uniref:4-hydroxythreonine-4-phosphate dehydrogenase PdxA n=1 Tax=Emticicia sp. CRIBPO TaxID=2683258 RepID=UPI0014125B10|nr:4-hydroxythreonine-4-phosphate dehydrogenase PdxA [Emticicia sp. CRIBPO]NBA84133.1 4-hydroxythreonine-4-phosphate dehydrogenase PdxA [Emticicia sp. CRIBPO]